MKNNCNGDEFEQARKINRAAEAGMLRTVEAGSNIAVKLWTLLAAIVAASIWIAGIQWQVSANKDYIEAEKRDKVQERLHDAEENGKRRDRQIDRLNREVFHLPDF